MGKTLYKYYCLLKPPGPDTLPANPAKVEYAFGVVEGRKCWGIVYYEQKLCEYHVESYGLLLVGTEDEAIMGTKEHAKIKYFAETMNEAVAMLHKQQKRVEELEAELAKTGRPVVKPIPCRKFKDAATLEWVAKLAEETNEVIAGANVLEEYADEDGVVDHDVLGIVDVKDKLSQELTDVITVCVSWLDALGYDEAERERLQERVNEKNRKRGYHDE